MRRRKHRIIRLIDGSIARLIVRPRLPLQDRRGRAGVGDDSACQLIDEIMRERIDLCCGSRTFLPPRKNVADRVVGVIELRRKLPRSIDT